MVKHLTVDKSGPPRRPPGLRPEQQSPTYGVGNLQLSSDALGQSNWGALLATARRQRSRTSQLADPVQLREPPTHQGSGRGSGTCPTNGFSPAMNEFTTAESEPARGFRQGRVGRRRDLVGDRLLPTARHQDGTARWSRAPTAAVADHQSTATHLGRIARHRTGPGSGSPTRGQTSRPRRPRSTLSCRRSRPRRDALAQQQQAKRRRTLGLRRLRRQNNELFPTADYTTREDQRHAGAPDASLFQHKSDNRHLGTLEQQSKTLLAAQQ